MAYAWGFGKYGQLGNGKLSNCETPQSLRLPSSARPTQISAGAHFTLVLAGRRPPKGAAKTPSAALEGAGDCLFACGWGKYGRLGTGSAEDQPLPAEVKLPKDGAGAGGGGACIKAVSAGHWHAGCVAEDGRVYLWGYNKSGILGVSESSSSSSGGASPKTVGPDFVLGPTLLSTPVRFKSIACGYNYTYAVSVEGKVYSWGIGRSGVLGHGDTNDRTRPELLSCISEECFTKVVCGYSHAALVEASGRLYTVGSDENGALGLGTNGRDRRTPTLVRFQAGKGKKSEPATETEVIVEVRDASCTQGEHHPHTLCCSAEGEVWSWGDGYKGKLGHGSQESCDLPCRVDPAHFLNQRICQVCLSLILVYSIYLSRTYTSNNNEYQIERDIDCDPDSYIAGDDNLIALFFIYIIYRHIHFIF